MTTRGLTRYEQFAAMKVNAIMTCALLHFCPHFLGDCLADTKTGSFNAAEGHRYTSAVLATSVDEASVTRCALRCLGSSQCMACNWHEETGTCELVGAHTGMAAATGYVAITRSCKLTQSGREYGGTVSVTASGRTCQHWGNDCNPHCPSSFNAATWLADPTALPANYCRNLDGMSDGPWCYTTDPDRRWEYCAVPFC